MSLGNRQNRLSCILYQMARAERYAGQDDAGAGKVGDSAETVPDQQKLAEAVHRIGTVIQQIILTIKRCDDI